MLGLKEMPSPDNVEEDNNELINYTRFNVNSFRETI